MESSSEGKRVLLIEPDAAMRRLVAERLEQSGFRPVTAGPGGSTSADRFDVEAVLLAHSGPSATRRRIRELGREWPGLPVLVLCNPEDVSDAAACLRHGADDYLLRPPDPAELHSRLERIVERNELDSRVAFFQRQLIKKTGARPFASHSAAMRAVVERIRRVAPRRSTILIQGESGVGKELVARAIHFDSPRRDHAFIALNCAAIPASLIESELFGHERGAFTGAVVRSRGKFEIAHRGTLFLDEIGEMDPSTQVKLLRVLEEQEFMRVGGERSLRVDVRVIAATNADLEELVATSRFREDLYYRLKVVTFAVPPLRERRDDIPDLVRTFMDDLARENGVERKIVTPEALQALQDYGWPGNVRELKNVLESILVSVPGKRMELEDLPSSVRGERERHRFPQLGPETTLAAMEHELILRSLEHTGGNRTHSAALLGIGVRTLQRKIAIYGLEIPPRRRRARRGGASSDDT